MPKQWKTLRLFIPMILPGMNQIIAEAKKYRQAYGKLKKRLEADLCMFIREQATGYKFSGAVYIKFCWVEKHTRRDPDNIAAGKKFLLDALQTEGVIGQDNWKHIIGWEDKWRLDKKNPGIELEITGEA